MAMRWIVCGCAAILVGLGFVFPQLAEIRMNGALTLNGICLLFLGVVGVLGGLGCLGRGVQRMRNL